MRVGDLLTDAFERVRDAVHDVVDGTTAEVLAVRPDDEANSVAWLVWHLTRVQDDHVAAAGTEQVWLSGWEQRFGLPLDPHDTGYGHRPDQVGAVKGEAEMLTGYFDVVHQATVDFVSRLAEDDLERVVDERFDPPVTLGVRLVSVLADDLQHVGQAAYVLGLVKRR